MLLRYERRNPSRFLALGLVALAVANVGGYLVDRKLGVPESVADPLRGFLYGVAIALTLLGVYLRGRRRVG